MSTLHVVHFGQPIKNKEALIKLLIDSGWYEDGEIELVNQIEVEQSSKTWGEWRKIFKGLDQVIDNGSMLVVLPASPTVTAEFLTVYWYWYGHPPMIVEELRNHVNVRYLEAYKLAALSDWDVEEELYFQAQQVDRNTAHWDPTP